MKTYLNTKYPARVALLICDAIHASSLAALREATQRRLDMHYWLRNRSEGGYIAVVENGRDCDGVQYWNKVRVVEATAQAIDKLVEYIADGADGPFELRLERPSVAHGLKYDSRDLGMEAYEDGHAHCIHG
jgi:hypothetical protein